MIRRFKLLVLFRNTALVMVFLMALLGSIPRLDAAFIPSTESPEINIQGKDLETVRQFIEQKAVKSRLEALGYSSEQIQSRLSGLSDQQVHQLASNIDSLATGGNGIGAVIGLLVIILLVIVILKLLDKQIIVR